GSSAPPSPDYVPGPEEPEQAPPSPDYVPGPEHDDDEIVAEDQAVCGLPTIALVTDSIPESEMMETMRWTSRRMRMMIWIEADEEDEDDEMDVEIDEEEHLTPAYLVVVALPATAPSAEETEPFETDESAATPPPHPAYRMTARISIPEPLPVPGYDSFPIITTSPVLTAPPPSPIRSLGYRAATIRMRAEACSNSLSLHYPQPSMYLTHQTRCTTPLPTSFLLFPPLSLPSQSRIFIERADSRLNYIDGIRYRSGSQICGYGITDFMGREMVETYREAPGTVTVIGQMSGQLLFRDRQWTMRITVVMETRLDVREAWEGNGCRAILLMERLFSLSPMFKHRCQRSQVTVSGPQEKRSDLDLLETDRRRREEMRELRAADRTRQQQLIQTLTVMQTLQRETIILQGLVTPARSREQQGPGGVLTAELQRSVVAVR
ncbi:hypothetical protein Tco_0462610, partial [Tanacetum coccineum]